jgi:CO/xanthine dehydrogenase FAD-binding subunit
MTTLQSMVDAPLLKELATGLLSHAARASSSSRLIRNSATIGGTLGAGLASQADVLPVLGAMDAEAVLRSASKTQLNLSGGSSEQPGLALSGVVYTGKQERRIPSHAFDAQRRSNELLVEVVVPRFGYSCGASLQRVGRTPTDVTLLSAVAVVEIEQNVYRRVRLVFGGVNMQPVRIQAVEQQLEGQPVLHPGDSQRLLAVLKSGMAEFYPPSDMLVSSGYRRVSGM